MWFLKCYERQQMKFSEMGRSCNTLSIDNDFWVKVKKNWKADVSLKRMEGWSKTEINLQIENSSLHHFLERNLRGVFILCQSSNSKRLSRLKSKTRSQRVAKLHTSHPKGFLRYTIYQIGEPVNGNYENKLWCLNFSRVWTSVCLRLDRH